MKKITLPDEINYIGVFLTLRCNLNCSYCINRQGDFTVAPEITAKDWIDGLTRIQTRNDLPITLQGGEPTMYHDFYEIAEALYEDDKHIDLLTNGLFNTAEFCSKVDPSFFNRDAKYASIRFSFHSNTNMVAMAMKVYHLKNEGFNVGIWGLDHPDMKEQNRLMKDMCDWLGIDFRMKEFLDKGCGTYKYPDAVVGNGKKQVLCKGSELLIDPAGNIFKCHADLYAARDSIGNILDEEIPEFKFRQCSNYGHCNPCDVKLKTNRLQEFGYCAVEIKGDG